jgi:peptide subunit release factor 1 (eRF1)
VDTVVASGSDQISDVIAATINSFVDQEEIESQAVVERLLREINTSGLAVAGTRETLNALQRSQVEVLVMAKDYGPEAGWSCPKCGAVGLAPQILIVCWGCGEAGLREIDLKAELARMAEQGGCQVEVVNYSDALMQLGGVGAILRYLSPEQYACAGHAQAGQPVG